MFPGTRPGFSYFVAERGVSRSIYTKVQKTREMRISCVCHRLLERVTSNSLVRERCIFFFLHTSLFSGERSGDGDMPKSLRDGKIDKETEREIQRKREERERERERERTPSLLFPTVRRPFHL